MKVFLLALTIFFSNIGFSQHGHFIRLYDNNNYQIAKGNLRKITDSTIIVQGNKNHVIEIHYSKIGFIKLRRSFEHTVTTVAVANAALYGILGATSANNTSSSSFFQYDEVGGFAIFAILGAIQGAVLGTVIGGTKSIIAKKITPVKGDYDNWLTASQQLNNWLKK